MKVTGYDKRYHKYKRKTGANSIILVILFLVSVFAAMMGWLIISDAKSAIHEIEAFLLFIISAILFCGAAIVDSINRLKKETEETAYDINIIMKSVKAFYKREAGESEKSKAGTQEQPE